jgi:hypothetical protein
VFRELVYGTGELGAQLLEVGMGLELNGRGVLDGRSILDTPDLYSNRASSEYTWVPKY